MEGSTVESEEARLQQLGQEIEKRTRIVNEIMPFLDAKTRAKQVALVESKVEERALLLEQRRVAAIIRRFEEEHPRETEDCPICLEPMPAHMASTSGAVARFLCCGKLACMDCYNLRAIRKCPLCRGEFPSSDEEEWQMILKLAERGCSWAQVEIANHHYGTKYMNATSDDMKKVHHERALEWYRQAAEQGDCTAETRLGKIYLATQSFEDARRWFEAAAAHGHVDAQAMLAIMCEEGQGGPVDYEQAIYWWTLSAANGGHDAEACLGCAFSTGDLGLDQCLYRTKFYLEKAATADNYVAMYHLAAVLWDLGKSVYGSNFIPGYSCVPRCLYWLRKALSKNEDAPIGSVLEMIEGEAKSCCGNCGKTEDACEGKLCVCARCKAVWYCGKDCQKQHWNDGHKIDCFSG